MSIYKSSSLAMIPSAYKDGKLYSVRPTDGSGDFTFSRGSNLAATRVASSGYIERGRENVLLQSNQFDTTWVKVNTTLTSGQAGYDGTNDAWLVNKSAASARVEQYISLSGVQTLSVYAKAGTLNWTRLNVDADWAYYDLANGVVGTATGSNIIDHSIEDIGGGWYRCVLVINRSTTTARIYPADADNNSGGTSGNIYIQDSQLESGLVSTSVIETTTTSVSAGILEDMPRLDYSGGASCPSLLLEPQRTNLAALSEYFEGWSHKVNITATSNYTTSPEGVQNATRLQFTANGFSYNINAPSQVNGAQHTLSCYAKRNDSGTQSFGFFTNGSGSVDSAMSLTSEWQRFTYTYTATNASQLGLAGLSGADVSVFGFQVEASASYATSYIPTYGTSQTRSKDSCLKTGIADLLEPSNGTIFFEMSTPDNSSNSKVITIGSSSSERIQVFYYQDSIRLNLTAGGTSQAYLQEAVTTTDTIKVAVSYATNNVKLFVNGVLQASDTSAAMPSALNYFRFDNGSGGATFIGSVKQAIVFPTALTDSECIALTTI